MGNTNTVRTILIGDIHGSDRQFAALLEKVNFSRSNDRLILLGDLIDRGPDSYSVIQRVVWLKKSMKERLIILRGSHEMLLLDRSSLKSALLWRMVGRASTVRSFRERGDDLFQYSQWIEENTVLFFEDEAFQCAHAAIKREPISENDEYTLMMAHFLTQKNQYAGKLTITGHIHLKKPAYFDGSGGKAKMLPYDQWLPLPAHGVICLDTGCGSGGCALTGMIVRGNQFCLISAL